MTTEQFNTLISAFFSGREHCTDGQCDLCQLIDKISRCESFKMYVCSLMANFLLTMDISLVVGMFAVGMKIGYQQAQAEHLEELLKK